MDELANLTYEQLVQYHTELIAIRQEILNSMADFERVVPTPEIGADGVPVQKGVDGRDPSMRGDFPNKNGYTLDGVNEMLGKVERKLQTTPASVSSLGPLWLQRGASQKVAWLK